LLLDGLFIQIAGTGIQQAGHHGGQPFLAWRVTATACVKVYPDIQHRIAMSLYQQYACLLRADPGLNLYCMRQHAGQCQHGKPGQSV
jgi:hypothetical protein